MTLAESLAHTSVEKRADWQNILNQALNYYSSTPPEVRNAVIGAILSGLAGGTASAIGGSDQPIRNALMAALLGGVVGGGGTYAMRNYGTADPLPENFSEIVRRSQTSTNLTPWLSQTAAGGAAGAAIGAYGARRGAVISRMKDLASQSKQEVPPINRLMSMVRDSQPDPTEPLRGVSAKNLVEKIRSEVEDAKFRTGMVNNALGAELESTRSGMPGLMRRIGLYAGPGQANFVSRAESRLQSQINRLSDYVRTVHGEEAADEVRRILATPTSKVDPTLRSMIASGVQRVAPQAWKQPGTWTHWLGEQAKNRMGFKPPTNVEGYIPHVYGQRLSDIRGSGGWKAKIPTMIGLGAGALFGQM